MLVRDLYRSRRTFLRAFGALGVTAGLPIAARAADTYTLRFALVSAPTQPNAVAARRFAEAVNKRTNGQLTVEVYPSGQLANEAGIINSLTTGVIDLTIDASGTLIPLVPGYQVFDVPFIFKDFNSATRVLDGRIGTELFSALDSKGIYGLGWGVGGFRELSLANKVVVVPDDMKGLRIRIVGGATGVETYRALGALPVPIDLTEAYTAISQHTVDGLESTLNTILLQKFYTIIKHVSMLNHVFAINPLLGSKRKIDALPPNLQTVVKEEGKAVIAGWRTAVDGETNGIIDSLKKNGIAFHEINYDAFQRAMGPVYASARPKIGGDLLDRVRRAASTT